MALQSPANVLDANRAPRSSLLTDRHERVYFLFVFFVFLVLTAPALFWGTQKVDEVEKYNLQPDEGTALTAVTMWNYPLTHWDGGGYFNVCKVLNDISAKLGIQEFLRRSFKLQGNGPILLIMRFLGTLSIFATGLVVFNILREISVRPIFAHLGMLLYVLLPAVQVNGHYMRSHIICNFMVSLFVWILARYYNTTKPETKLSLIRQMFVLSGLLFSFRYPMLLLAIVPLFLLLRTRDFKRAFRYTWLSIAAAFAVNPFFFIHPRSSLFMARNNPPLQKFHDLTASRSVSEFATLLQPLAELRSIFLRILPDSTGGLAPVLIFLACIAAYLLLRKRQSVIDWLMLLTLGYIGLWILWGQTIHDGLSRFALPVLLVLSILVPYCFDAISQVFPKMKIVIYGLGLLLLASAALYSTELLYQMASTDPRFAALKAVGAGNNLLLLEPSWDYGFFKAMTNRVAVIPVEEIGANSGAIAIYVDIPVRSSNPFDSSNLLVLRNTIRKEPLLPFWKDEYYLHDYKYFAPTVYVFTVR